MIISRFHCVWYEDYTYVTLSCKYITQYSVARKCLNTFPMMQSCSFKNPHIYLLMYLRFRQTHKKVILLMLYIVHGIKASQICVSVNVNA